MSGCNKDRRSALVCAAYNVTDMNTVIIVVIMWCKFLFTGCLFARFYAKETKRAMTDKNLRSFFLIYFMMHGEVLIMNCLLSGIVIN